MGQINFYLLIIATLQLVTLLLPFPFIKLKMKLKYTLMVTLRL